MAVPRSRLEDVIRNECLGARLRSEDLASGLCLSNMLQLTLVCGKVEMVGKNAWVCVYGWARPGVGSEMSEHRVISWGTGKGLV